MLLKKKIMQNNRKHRGKYRSTRESKPRKPEGTILGDMEEILRLVEKGKRIKRGGYE